MNGQQMMHLDDENNNNNNNNNNHKQNDNNNNNNNNTHNHHNLWSESEYQLFFVRGNNYFSSRQKISSDPFIFKSRGVELFLTNKSPNNVGSNLKLLNGQLREKPTFIINFKLPFGVLIFYYEIPQRFVPYLVRKKQNQNEIDNDNDNNNNNATDISTMKTPGDRAICRFLMGNDNYRHSTLKLIPKIVDGPWIVKTAVPGNKPAIIGNKVPVSYTYGPPVAKSVVSKNKNKTATSSSSSSSSTSLAPYLEADLDIAGSSKSAKAIMNICMSYAKSITVDLGFVIQGNQQDELPEQMLVGTRLHKIDPYTAPSYPNPN